MSERTFFAQWLDRKMSKPRLFKVAKRHGIERAYIRIGLYYKEKGRATPWQDAFLEALHMKRAGYLVKNAVNALSFPRRAFLYQYYKSSGDLEFYKRHDVDR